MSKSNNDKIAKPKTFRKIFDFFNAPVMQVDCGSKCASINDGEPVCCDTGNAVPIVAKAEWKLLKSRTKMWKKFKPYDAATRQICDEISDQCKAVECRGARKCERDNRSLACRTFPFFPYITKDGDILGLTHYWIYEGRCWVMAHMDLVEQPFIDEFLKAYRIMFKADPEEYQVFFDHSASMRRVFSRNNRPIPVITPDREYLLIKPKGQGMEKVSADAIRNIAPFEGED